MIQRVSVVMCTCNGAAFIREQMDSILAQTYPLFEILVQDDASTDETYSILLEYAKKFSIVKVYQNATRAGVNNNFISAIRIAESHLGSEGFIAISDQDDIWEKDKIERQMEAVGNHLLCSCRTVPFSQDDTEISNDTRTPNYSLLRLVYTNSLAGHTLLFPVKFLSLIPDNPQYKQLRMMYDSLLVMMAASYDDIVFVEKTLVRQRRHMAAVTYAVPTNNKKSLRNILKTGVYCWHRYWKHRPQLREYSLAAHRFLSQIPSDALVLQDALRMLELQSKKSLISLLCLSFFCYKHQTELFYAVEKKGFKTGLRALTFPIFCSIYFKKDWGV